MPLARGTRLSLCRCFRNPLAGFWKTCGIGLFYRNYRSLLEETHWLDCCLASVCLETRCLGQKPWFLSPGTTVSLRRHTKIMPSAGRHSKRPLLSGPRRRSSPSTSADSLAYMYINLTGIHVHGSSCLECVNGLHRPGSRGYNKTLSPLSLLPSLSSLPSFSLSFFLFSSC